MKFFEYFKYMKLKSVLLLASAAIALTAVLTIQSCKNDSVVETPNPTTQNPNAPELLSPNNEGTINFFTPVLDWNDFSGATSYRVQISMDANFAGTMIIDSSGISSSQFVVPNGKLTTSIYNYWRVSAAVSGGYSPWSSTWRFRIILSAPAAPVLISPPNGSINQPFTPLLDWNDVDSADFYRVQIASSPAFNIMLLDTGRIYVSQYQVPQFILNVNTPYFWRVNASNSNGASTGPWSSTWSFTTMNGPQPNSISGLITFADTNFLQLPLYYKVGAFAEWPPFSAISFDSLEITHVGNLYQANYRITRLFDGQYYIAVFPEVGSLNGVNILGIYGCDTVHVEFSNCPLSPTSVSIINNWGVEGINFLSWADTSKSIF